MPTSHRMVAAALCAISGLAVIFAMGAQLRHHDLGMILSAGGGALIGGSICAGLFGHPKGWGLGLALMGGAPLATIIGSAVAGVTYGIWVGPTLLGVIYGPATVGCAILTDPLVAAAWLATMVLAHVVMRQRRGHSPILS